MPRAINKGDGRMTLTKDSNAMGFTPGPWVVCKDDAYVDGSDGKPVAYCRDPERRPSAMSANAHLIAAAPDHALLGWAMCIQDGRWEEWVPFDGRGEFIFAGIRYCTKLDQFGCVELTPALRSVLTNDYADWQSRGAKAGEQS